MTTQVEENGLKNGKKKNVSFKVPCVDEYIEPVSPEPSFTIPDPLTGIIVEILNELSKLTSRKNVLVFMVYVLHCVNVLTLFLQITQYRDDFEVHCELDELLNTNWTFEEIQTLISPSHRKGCYYYDCNYASVTIMSYENASVEIQKCVLNKPKIKTCESFVYKPKIDKIYSVVQQLDLKCDQVRCDYCYNYTFLYTAFFTFVCGILGDAYGRKFTYILGAVIALIGGFLIPTATNKHMFTAGYVMKISGCSVTFFSSLVIFTEICPSYRRTLLLMFGFSLQFFSYIIQGLLISKIEIWRLLEVAVQCPLILVAFGIVFLPESPRWLMVKHEYAKVWEILKELGSLEEKSVENIESKKTLFASLILFKQQNFVYRISLIAFLIVCCQVALCVLEGMELNDKEMFDDLNINTRFSQTILIMFMGTLSHYIDKRTLLFSTYLFLATCFSISTSTDSDSFDHVALMAGVICAILPRPLIFIYALELFPTTYRSTAIGCCCSLTAITNFIYQLFFSFLVKEELIIVAETICCSLCIISALLMLFSPVPSRELPNVLKDINTSQFIPKYR